MVKAKTVRDDYPVTGSSVHVIRGIEVHHEVYDGVDKFRHRLRIGGICGHWVAYEWFAQLEVTLATDTRKYMGVQNNWTGMFPQVFEVVHG